ncbi:hypothetical protein HJC23_010353 [Cyclotella cryptica]|uniref:Uncharacterized protein n=1 Tax=Cyclotella cryptica TaxID=29204 RepID=A0ABD3NY53_9STRA
MVLAGSNLRRGRNQSTQIDGGRPLLEWSVPHHCRESLREGRLGRRVTSFGQIHQTCCYTESKNYDNIVGFAMIGKDLGGMWYVEGCGRMQEPLSGTKIVGYGTIGSRLEVATVACIGLIHKGQEAGNNF